MFNIADINKDWTLFLDRDGVINVEKNEDYIRNWDEFVFYDGVLEAMHTFSKRFATIVLVTNQRGVGKGLMSLADLESIHANMLQHIQQAGGRINKIYFCTDLNNDSPNRKPNAGMALQAKHDFPQIDFSKSIIAGNKLSDMHFGRNAGMHTAFIATTHPDTYPHPFIDVKFDNLAAFAASLR
jgi:histidinol-phosphate phosphatase family protein